jgi:DNA-binding NtrC family response regulator
MTKLEPAKILIVDDEPIIRETLAEFLQGEGFEVTLAATGEAAIKLAESHLFDLVLCDVNLPGLDGIQVLEAISKRCPETFVILITAYATVETAIEAFTRGAHDYLMKPVILHDVLAKIRRVLATRDLFRENQWLRRELTRTPDAETVIGRSPAIRKVYELARKVAPTPSTVLILGESGTGKEVLARAIHRYSQEAKPTDGRFLAINCAAIPHDLLENQLFGHRRGAFTGADRDAVGVFVHAGPGTVFLDEIAEIPLATQAKLLRAIELKEVLPVGANEPIKVEARILAATNKNLEAEVKAGRFREDLFYRINVVNITLPPLRERREDLADLVDFLLAKHARAMTKKFTGVSHEAMQLLMNHDWKGNVREVDNVLQRAVILGEGPLVQPSDLPPDLRPRPDDPFAVDDLNEAVLRFEKQHIERMLRTTPDKREAAKKLGIGLSSLYRKIDLCGLSPRMDHSGD